MRTYVRTTLLALACAASTPAAAQEIQPVVDVQRGYLLGAPVNGTWREGQHIAARVRAGRSYRVLGPSGVVGVSTGSRARANEDVCQETYQVELSPEREAGEVAVGGAWNVLPRPVTRLSPAAAAGYAAAVRQILMQHGIRNPVARVTAAIRADLDGDGTDEVVIAATRSSEALGWAAHAGDYSIVFARKLAGGTVRTIMLEQEYHPRASPDAVPNEYTLAGAWDLDGDGQLEIMVRGRYYEGDWTTLYRLRGTTALKLVSVGCGV
jgi:hypothetical protein